MPEPQLDYSPLWKVGERSSNTPAAKSREKPHIDVSRYLWAMLLARIYEAFPLICPIFHAQMRIIAFINDASTVRKILDHIGESPQPPRIAPVRGPPRWEAAAAAVPIRRNTGVIGRGVSLLDLAGRPIAPYGLRATGS